MPICNPIKRSAALLQSCYDSLLPRGTDRESGATQVCLCLGEGVCAGRNAGETEQSCVSVCVCVPRPDPPQQRQNWVSSYFRERISR